MVPAVEHIVLGRLAYGASDRDLQIMKRDGIDGWVAAQLAAPAEDDPALAARLAALPLHIRYDAGDGYAAVDEMRPLRLLNQDIATLWPLTDNKIPMNGAERSRPRDEVAVATIMRAIHSPWQLREVMVNFWHDHFSVTARETPVMVALPAYDRMIRANALGNFRTLLEEVARSTAMQYSLNNQSSRTGSPNENYARELFELHTLGRDAYLNALYNRWRDVPGAANGQPQGYVDEDVYEAARAFTGWTVENGASVGGNLVLPSTGRFAYLEAWHDGYQKRVLATEFDPFRPAMADGRNVLDLVAFHPATARFLCQKLCRRLIADDPPPALVASATQVWMENNQRPDQIRQVVAHIARAPAMRSGFGGKVKRPLELVAGFARAAGIDVTVTQNLLGELDGSGQRLFGWPAPDGYPDRMAYWLGSHVFRHRVSLLSALLFNPQNNSGFDAASRMPADLGAAEVVGHWHARLTGVAAEPATVAALLRGLKVGAQDKVARQDKTVRQIALLTAMTPTFNYR